MHLANRFERRKGRTRLELLTAAKRVLAERGYYGAKVADIAAAADVGVGTFYLYYPTKDALFLELVEESARILLDDIRKAKEQIDDPREKARVGCATFFHFARENRELFKIVFGHGAEFNEFMRRTHARFVHDIAEDLRLGMEKGVFLLMDAEIIANAIVGMVSQVVSWWIEKEEASIHEVIDTVMKFTFQGLVPKEE